MTEKEEKAKGDRRFLAADELDEEYRLLLSDPKAFLDLANERIGRNADDPNAHFDRSLALQRMGSPDLALAALDRALSLEDHYWTRQERGKLLYTMGRYQEAIDQLGDAQAMEPDSWPHGFGPLFRADCHARLGNVEAALADCALLPEDHWTPGLFGAPAGSKSEVTEAIRRRATAARRGQKPDD